LPQELSTPTFEPFEIEKRDKAPIWKLKAEVGKLIFHMMVRLRYNSTKKKKN
jgi:hypothetical protein